MCVCINACTQTLPAASSPAEIHQQQSAFGKHSPAAPAHSWALIPPPPTPLSFPSEGLAAEGASQDAAEIEQGRMGTGVSRTRTGDKVGCAVKEANGDVVLVRCATSY